MWEVIELDGFDGEDVVTFLFEAGGTDAVVGVGGGGGVMGLAVVFDVELTGGDIKVGEVSLPGLTQG